MGTKGYIVLNSAVLSDFVRFIVAHVYPYTLYSFNSFVNIVLKDKIENKWLKNKNTKI